MVLVRYGKCYTFARDGTAGMEEVTKPKDNTRASLLILGLLLLASVGLNIYQFLDNRNLSFEHQEQVALVDTLTQRKQELELHYSDAVEELNAYRGRSEQLDSLLAEANLELEEQRRQISRLIDQNQDYQVLQQRFAEMQRLKDEYLARIVALEEENRRLKYENTELTVALNQTQETNTALQTKVNIASQLQFASVQVKGLDIRSGGREKETDKARRTDRISIRFTVAENKVAPPGERTVYLRLFNPEGYVMADVGTQLKKFRSESGEELPYSKSVKLQFTGAALTKEVVWEQEVFPEGVYKVELYVDGMLTAIQQVHLY